MFVHPNCKYDAKCTQPDHCPFSHMSRIAILPLKLVKASTPSSGSQLCFCSPACKRMECPFYHPKHWSFSTQCTRPDCMFHHPAITVPPRCALEWIRPWSGFTPVNDPSSDWQKILKLGGFHTLMKETLQNLSNI